MIIWVVLTSIVVHLSVSMRGLRMCWMNISYQTKANMLACYIDFFNFLQNVIKPAGLAPLTGGFFSCIHLPRMTEPDLTCMIIGTRNSRVNADNIRYYQQPNPVH